MARREWEEKVGVYKKTWTARSNRKVRINKPVAIPPMPMPWQPETYPWLITGERWDFIEKNCWIEVMMAEKAYKFCGDLLNEKIALCQEIQNGGTIC